MAWTDIDLYKPNQLIDATALDTLRTNIEHLHSPNFASYQHPGTGANYTNTGTLGDDVDSTNFNLSVTTYGENSMVLAGFYCVVGVNAGSVRLNIIRVDPVTHYGRNLFYNYTAESAQLTANIRGLGWIQRFPNLPAGTHQFKAVWGISGGTATMYVAHRPYMWVLEK
jgi:hypothetical protein